MSEWKKVRLGDLITDIAAGPFGSNLKISCFVPSGFPIIDGANLKGFKVTDNITKFVTEEKARSLARSIAKRNDVIVTISGTLGQIAYIPEESGYEEYLCSQRQFRATFDQSQVDVPFLVYYFHSHEGQQKILVYANQVGVPALYQPLKNFRLIEISLPPLPTQRKIAAVLSSLDDKIENNRKICANLEAQAQAIFKSWFVDFEPFVGKMPQGWKMGKLGDVAELMRQTITPNEMVEVVEHYSLPAYDEAHYPAYDNSNNIKSNKFKVGKDSILVSKLNPAIKRLWDPFVDTETAVASTEFVVIDPRDKRNRYFVYGVLDSPAFYAYAKSNVSGTTNSHQRISPEQILCFETVLPDEKWIEKFCDAVSPMYWGIKKRIKESRALAATRDALLPKLMSGEIDVEKVEVA